MSDFQALWREMEANPGDRSYGLLRRRLTADRDDGLFLGLDPASHRRLFLVDLPPGIDFSTRDLPRWREIEVQRIVLQQKPFTIRILIALANQRFTDIFTAFANDLYRTLARIQVPTALPGALSGRLDKWNHFFRETGPEGLTEERQRGLFAELHFLHRHVLPRQSAVDALRAWRGPDAADHDFQVGIHHVEVKAVGIRPGRVMHISNERQLDETGLDSLSLYWLIIEPAEAGDALPDLVANFRQAVSGDKDAEDLLEQKLLMAGYLDVHSSSYLQRYRLVEEALCQIHNGFPRIVNPAAGISHVRYDLSIEPCRPFQVNLATKLDAIFGSGGG